MWEYFSEEEIAILKQRAKQLLKSDEDKEAVQLLSTLLVQINAVQYAFPIDDLVAVYLNVPIVAVPSVPKFIKGISNLRGYITPVLDLAELFNIQQADNKQQKSYCILAQYQENICAFHVQRVDDIQSINLDTLSAISDQAYKHDYLRGISADDVVLINTKAILEDKSLIVDELMQ